MVMHSQQSAEPMKLKLTEAFVVSSDMASFGHNVVCV